MDFGNSGIRDPGMIDGSRDFLISLTHYLWFLGSEKTDIQLNVIPLIPTSYSQEICDGWNGMSLNLSYSFVAGYIFYLLTVVLKDYYVRKKMKKVFRNKVKQIASPIEAVIDVFDGRIDKKTLRTREGITNTLNSRNLNDKVKMAQELGHRLDSSATYINFLASECKVSKDRVFEMIKLYCDYLSTNEILLLESYAEMRIIDVSSVASNIKCINPERSEVKNAIISQFCDLYDKLNEVRSAFN